jgi:hypothetical protein
MNAARSRALSFLVTLGTLLAFAPLASAQQGPFELPDDHFLCYKGKTVKGDLVLPTGLQVNLTDQFEADRDYDVRKPWGICNPADKEGEGMVDPDTHLTQYQLRAADGEPKHVPQANVRVFNQFGNIWVDTIKEDRILLPATKDAAGGPVVEPINDSHNVDPYKCYRVKSAKGSPRPPKGLELLIEDQFETPAKRYVLKKARLLCNPVDTNGQGIKNPDGHLMCYQVKPAKGEPKHEKRKGISTADRFVVHQIDTKKEELLCVPSLKNPPDEFCGDGVVNQPPFEQCDGDPTVCQPGQTCTRLCECVTAPPLGQRTFSLDPESSAFLSNFTGQTPVATPVGTLVLDGGPIDWTDTAPVSLAAPPYHITVDINLGVPQTTCYEVLSCMGSVHCSGGFNVDVLESLDSLSTSEPGCIQDGTNSCPDDPSSLCCTNSCEGTLIGSGNIPVPTLGVGATNSGDGALAMTCDMRVLMELPLGSDCSIQDYSAQPIETHALTTGMATSEITQHCAGPASPPDEVVTFAATGVGFDCEMWTIEDGPGTIVWALPTEEPTAFVPGDGANAFIFAD